MVTTDNQVFIQQVNDAFLNGDTGYFETNVVDDVRWTVVGSPSIEGKAAFMAEVETMKEGPAPEFSITNVIVHEASAAVEGTMTKMDESE
ncbi:MAG: nuclear transport factor 2 family protein [Thermomicrobiales bacterium]